jgi:hypothetical protein
MNERVLFFIAAALTIAIVSAMVTSKTIERARDMHHERVVK